MKKIFKYRNDDHKYREYKHGDECDILGFTYQDVGPVVWTLHLADGNIVGVNPSCIEFSREISEDWDWRSVDYILRAMRTLSKEEK